MARQGVRYQVVDGHIVGDPKTCKPVPQDGADDGRDPGPGQHRDARLPEGPEGDRRGVRAAAGCTPATSPCGTRRNYIEIKDRKKDIIISGGENISSVEVEIALYKHPATALAAVVARPDEKWGETPCAFVQLKPGAQATEAEYHRVLPRATWRASRCRRRWCSATLPTTATGKIQKYVLRERAKSL